mmetsp:Transcript_15536/g.21275  ORF Transcript_15536/g.21275 Transcript_15536/m.21275 type:complete len:272 (+) Transcript_15536:1790-2605(+)
MDICSSRPARSRSTADTDPVGPGPRSNLADKRSKGPWGHAAQRRRGSGASSRASRVCPSVTRHNISRPAGSTRSNNQAGPGRSGRARRRCRTLFLTYPAPRPPEPWQCRLRISRNGSGPRRVSSRARAPSSHRRARHWKGPGEAYKAREGSSGLGGPRKVTGCREVRVRSRARHLRPAYTHRTGPGALGVLRPGEGLLSTRASTSWWAGPGGGVLLGTRRVEAKRSEQEDGEAMGPGEAQGPRPSSSSRCCGRGTLPHPGRRGSGVQRRGL